MTDDEEQLVRDHHDLVGRLVDRKMRSVPTWIDRDELAGVGMLALVQSAQRFDPTLGVPFGAFAKIRIDGAIRDSLRSGDWLPARVRAAQRQIVAAELALRADSNGAPSEVAIASAAGITVEDLRVALQRSTTAEVLSLEEQVERRGDHEDAVTSQRRDEQPEDSFIDTCMVARLRSMLDHLSDTQRAVLVGTYLEGHTGVEVAAQLGVSPSRVSQLGHQALATLRVWLDSVPVGGTPGEGTPA